MTEQIYSVIYADPPWSFSTYSRKGKGRSAEAHYDCMSLDQIKAVPVKDWAAPDCVLLLWTTDPFLEKAFEVIRAWGFAYKTVGFYWMKQNWTELTKKEKKHAGWILSNQKARRLVYPIGTGYWTRANPEQCLLATRGHPKRLNADVRKLIVSPRREHSRKPDETYERIERLCQGPYLELFARSRRDGWDSWGNEDGISPRRWPANSYPGALNAPDAPDAHDDISNINLRDI